MCVSQNVTAGTVCPDAHFCVFLICVITNNAVPIKYRTENITYKYFSHR